MEAKYNSTGSGDLGLVRAPFLAKYSVLSGTSMSYPHVVGVAAYVKTFHPKWSPSMIQSAIITTSYPVNANGSGIASTEFAYGAGHFDPITALNFGLVYELEKTDHITLLCAMNYTSKTKLISSETVTCAEENNILPRNLKYPSLMAQLSGFDKHFHVTFNRCLTNVSTPNFTFISKVVVGHVSKLSVDVTPSVFSFTTVNEKQYICITVSERNLDSEVLRLPTLSCLMVLITLEVPLLL